MNGSNLKWAVWLVPVVAATFLLIRLTHLRAENAHLAALPSPAPIRTSATPVPPPTQATETDRLAMKRLRHELANLHTRIAARERQIRTAPSLPPATTTGPTPSLTEALLPPTAWQDLGAKTPAALIETVLWAGAGGDVQRIASALEFDAKTLAAANTLWDQIPLDPRPAQADGRALIALLTTDAIPLNNAQIVGEYPAENGDHTIALQFETSAANDQNKPYLRTLKFTTRRNAETGDWQILVPPSAIDRFTQSLGITDAP